MPMLMVMPMHVLMLPLAGLCGVDILFCFCRCKHKITMVTIKRHGRGVEKCCHRSMHDNVGLETEMEVFRCMIRTLARTPAVLNQVTVPSTHKSLLSAEVEDSTPYELADHA